jgi:DNA-binding NtrC family response regulator
MKPENNFRIAVVDDDLFSITATKNYLGLNGYPNVRSFESGTAFLDNMSDGFDIVFLDHNMEDMNGFEVLKKIKRYDPNIFVVMLSGQDKIATAVDALKYGAFDYIIKDQEAYERIFNVISRIATLSEMIAKAKPSIWKKIGTII